MFSDFLKLSLVTAITFGITFACGYAVEGADRVFPIESEIDGYLAVKRLTSVGGGDIVDLTAEQQKKVAAILQAPDIVALQQRIRVARSSETDGVLLSPDFPAFDRAISARLHQILEPAQIVVLRGYVLLDILPTPESLLHTDNRWELCGGTEEERQTAIRVLAAETEKADATYNSSREVVLQGLFSDLTDDQRVVVCGYFGSALSPRIVPKSLGILKSHNFSDFLFWVRGNPKRTGSVNTAEKLSWLQEEQGKRIWNLVRDVKREPTAAELKALNDRHLPSELESLLGDNYIPLMQEYQREQLASRTRDILKAQDFQTSISANTEQMELIFTKAVEVERNLAALRLRRNAKRWKTVLSCSTPVRDKLTPVLGTILDAK